MHGYFLSIAKTYDSNDEENYYIFDSSGVCIGQAPTLELAFILIIIYIKYLLSVNNLNSKAKETIENLRETIEKNEIKFEKLLDKTKDITIIERTMNLFSTNNQDKEVEGCFFKKEIENIEIQKYQFNPECIKEHYINLIKGNEFLFIEKGKIDFDKIKEKNNPIEEDKHPSNFKKTNDDIDFQKTIYYRKIK
ncbi:hypothetical protein H2Y56_00425 [Pectobacterium aroidearum]|uniref:Uncharacterized protein n=1 Tax=Pectobacterium aroidearum TaxID=1201031 RepID=A0ABR5Z7S1_9GAMM|nr:hypothetical protein [Pectobacterium aroidearum]MBA5197788.1 hypothetical protein [Pectobacterium aroidearum]MBA5230581.1 hypothetical protein [Pectobacterium aroidearum]